MRERKKDRGATQNTRKLERHKSNLAWNSLFEPQYKQQTTYYFERKSGNSILN